MIGYMNKKITTIDELAVMLEGAFQKIEKRLDVLESGSNEIKAEIVQLRKDFKDVDTRTAVIAIELRVSALERKVDLSPQKR
jgi:hypothetical protein